MSGRPPRAAWRTPDELTPLQACAVLGVRQPRLAELIAMGVLRSRWVAGRQVISGVGKLVAWRAANVAGFTA